MSQDQEQVPRYIRPRIRMAQAFMVVIFLGLAFSFFKIQNTLERTNSLIELLNRSYGTIYELNSLLEMGLSTWPEKMMDNISSQLETLKQNHRELMDSRLAQTPAVLKFGRLVGKIDELFMMGKRIHSEHQGGGLATRLAPVIGGMEFVLDSLTESIREKQSSVQQEFTVQLSYQSQIFGFILLGVCLFVFLAARSIRKRVLQPMEILAEIARSRNGPISSYSLIERGYEIKRDEIGYAIKKVLLLQEALQAKNEELEKQVYFKNNFVSQISHEIRTPLNSIVGLCELSLNDSSGQGDRDALQKIQRSSHYLIALVGHVLDYQKVSEGLMQVKSEPIEVGELLDTLRSCFDWAAKQKGLEFYAEPSADLPSQIVGDKTRLEQILHNLVGNAIKFTHTGSVRVKLECSSDKTRLIIRVVDTGVGIPGDQIDRIFEPYYQSESGLKYGLGGTGLGLSLCVGLCKMLCGQITVESQPHKGSEFVVDLPLVTDLPVAQPSQSALKGSWSPRFERVLLVDDHVLNLKVNAALLENAGFQVELAESGEQAVERVLQAHQSQDGFDVVLMDIHMGGISGVEATRRIHEQLDVRQRKIIESELV